MNTNSNNPFEGAGLKFKLEISAPGFSMVNDDFSIVLKQNTIEREIPKSQFIEHVVTENGEEKHEFYFCFDSSLFRPGVLTCIVRAYVPDTDFQGGIRLEIDKFSLTVINPV